VPDQQQHELREPESAAASAALVPATAFGVPVSSPAAMTDREIEQSFRVAKALAQSGLYKDVESAEQAFAKLLMGRDLGLSHSQSLSLYAMDGKVEVPYHLLATFVRRRPGYGFAIEWRYADGGEGRWVAATDVEGNAGGEVTGARITFTVDGIVAGVSTFTVEDAVTAELTGTRGGRKSNHVKYPRNMFLARAMSNGCRWYVPEVLAGLPVYAEGELPRTEALGQGVGRRRAVMGPTSARWSSPAWLATCRGRSRSPSCARRAGAMTSTCRAGSARRRWGRVGCWSRRSWSARAART
jgi:hypothetical protein